MPSAAEPTKTGQPHTSAFLNCRFLIKPTVVRYQQPSHALFAAHFVRLLFTNANMLDLCINTVIFNSLAKTTCLIQKHLLNLNAA